MSRLIAARKGELDANGIGVIERIEVLEYDDGEPDD
jgi:hypothetical protein